MRIFYDKRLIKITAIFCSFKHSVKIIFSHNTVIAGTKAKIYDFHSCANDRGTPGKDNFDWPAIVQALKDVGYDDYMHIESFTPDCVEIAKAASVWRPFSESPEAIARDGIPFLKSLFN
jgi:D-psicose/D-tagatose/L-ribulose 3-epimerase